MQTVSVRFFAGGIKHFAPMLVTYWSGHTDLVKTRADSPLLGFFLSKKARAFTNPVASVTPQSAQAAVVRAIGLET